MNLAVGITDEEDQALYEAYHEQKINYEQWTDELLRLYKERGLATKDFIEQTLADFDFSDGVAEAISYLKQEGYQLAIISGSFKLLTEAVAERLGIDKGWAYGCTRFVFNDDNFVSGLLHDSDETAAKLRKLEEFCTKLGITTAEAACVGDGANDIPMFQKPVTALPLQIRQR